MRIAVLSDLHLGADARADRFGHAEQDFLRFLDFLQPDFERIVLCGDVFECLRPRGAPTRWQASRQLRLARERHRALAERFGRPPYVTLAGNHDLALMSEGAPRRLVLESDGLRILLLHGDELAPLTRWLEPASGWVNWARGWAARAGWKQLGDPADTFETWALGVRRDPDADHFQARALRMAERVGADVVVCGHTHVPAVTRPSRFGGRVYMNAGCCSEGRLSWLSLDTRRLDLAHHEGY